MDTCPIPEKLPKAHSSTATAAEEETQQRQEEGGLGFSLLKSDRAAAEIKR